MSSHFYQYGCAGNYPLKYNLKSLTEKKDHHTVQIFKKEKKFYLSHHDKTTQKTEEP